MKYINSLIICIISSIGIMQAQNYICTGYSGGIVSPSGDSATINLCAVDYNPNTVGDDPHTMSVNLPSGRRYSITGRVELEQVQYLDYITLREEDAAGNTVSTLASYWGCTIDNIHLITKSTTGRIRVDIFCAYGATSATSGFEFTIAPATVETIEVGHVLGALGIGTNTPQKELHVVGDVRISSNNGKWMQLSSSSRYPLFSTNADMFDFNRPIRTEELSASPFKDLVLSTDGTPRITIDDTTGYVGIGTTTPQTTLHVNGNIRGNGELGALTIETESGTTTIGAQGWSYSHFNTTLPRFYFYKPIEVGNGEFSSSSSSDLKLQTFHVTHLTIKRQNGYVGIGKGNPTTKLDVAGGIHADSIHTDKLATATFTANELLSDSLRTGVIKTGAIFVDSAYGADFVFDNNYQLRSLQDVYLYIQEHGHLPEIQSAADMQQNGVNMSEFQIQLLQKIEELTLYLIKQEQTIQELREELENVK